METVADIKRKLVPGLATGSQQEKMLAPTILNEHSGWTERSRVLVRTVDNEVRGVLSENYRRLDSVDILTAFVNAAKGQGAEITDAHMNDTKIYAETIIPMPFPIPTQKNGNIIMYFGARFSTSDYGDGALDIRTFLMNGVCLNGMVRESMVRHIHLGAKLPDNLQLSRETYLLDTKATVSAVQDLTKELFDAQTIKRKALEIQTAAKVEVDFDQELKRLVKENGLLKAESEGVKKILMDNRRDDGMQGEATKWKLTQAITAHARELAPDRKRELQELSGQLLNNLKIS